VYRFVLPLLENEVKMPRDFSLGQRIRATFAEVRCYPELCRISVHPKHRALPKWWKNVQIHQETTEIKNTGGYDPIVGSSHQPSFAPLSKVLLFLKKSFALPFRKITTFRMKMALVIFPL
jgi:hypothetical protein